MNKIIYGIHTLQSFIEKTPNLLQEVFILKHRENRRLLPLIKIIKKKEVIIKLVNRKFLDKKSKGAVHQGIIAIVKYNNQYQKDNLINLSQIFQFDNIFLLILDRITDPHNLGSCLRSAEAAGVHAIIIPKNHSAQINATVRKVACGAVETLKIIRVTNLSHTICILKKNNIWIVGTDEKASRTLYQSKMTGKVAIVMGSEDKGIRHLIRKQCDEIIKIPMVGSISSLNISVAAGICLFEAVRQRSLFAY